MKLSLSILDFDLSNLNNELEPLYDSIDYIHLDVMDGVFVPNISFGPALIKSLRNKTKVVFDTHLMITEPIRYIEKFVSAGSDIITIHLEATKEIRKTLELIKSHNILAGISIKPKTNVDEILPYLDLVDLVLVMSVEPGFGGQKFMENSIKKLEALRELQLKYNFKISIDGGINLETIKLIKDKTDIFVVGSQVAKADDKIMTIKKLKDV